MSTPSKAVKSVVGEDDDGSHRTVDPISHILMFPEVYLGSTVHQTRIARCITSVGDGKKVLPVSELKEFTSSRALRTVVKEIVSNAADEAVSNPAVTAVHVTIEYNEFPPRLQFTVKNNGSGIRTTVSGKSNGMPVMEMVAGELHSSSNYDKGDEKAASKFLGVGGRYGLGMKLTNVTSTRFQVTSCDTANMQTLVTEWTDHMRTKIQKSKKRHKATKIPKQPFTSVSWTPDLEFFKIDRVTPDIINDIRTLMFEFSMCLSALPQRVALKWFEQRDAPPSPTVELGTKLGSSEERSVELVEKELGSGECKSDEKAPTFLLTKPVTIPVKSVKDFTRIIFSVPADVKLGEICVFNKAGAQVATICLGFMPTVEHDEHDVYHSRIIGYINSIPCPNGSHVDFAIHAIMKRLEHEHLPDSIKSKFGAGFQKTLRNCISKKIVLVVNGSLTNPTFGNQMKTTLKTRVSDEWMPIEFERGSVLSIIKASPIVKDMEAKLKSRVDKGLAAQQSKQVREAMSRDPAGGRTRCNIENLTDAKNAGKKNTRAVLWLTEGVSAMSMIFAALSILKTSDRDVAPGISGHIHDHGMYPLRGKVLNAAKSTPEKLLSSAVSQVFIALGLRKTYDYANKEHCARLRYRGIVVATDQDVDGSHIAALIMNALHNTFPTLLPNIPDFVRIFSTPLLELSHKSLKNTFIEFTSMNEYDMWKSSTRESERKKWNVTYKKGLGSSTSKDAKRYIRNLRSHLSSITWDDACAIITARMFNKECAQDRRDVMDAYNRDDFIKYGDPTIYAGDFMKVAFIQFAIADVERSLPCMDGLKEVQRKLVYATLHQTSFKRVVEITGDAMARTNYHHGDKSMGEAASGMGRMHKFGLSLPVFMPQGQCGSSDYPPKEATASPRYLFLRPNRALVAALYNTSSLPVLKRAMSDSGTPIEPLSYAPPIPGPLVNGSKGIGTGHSSTIPPYKCEDLVNIQRLYIDCKQHGGDIDTNAAFKKACDDILPHWDQFEGSVTRDASKPTKIHVKGAFELVYNDEGLVKTIVVTELPPKCWTFSFKTMLMENFFIGAKSPKPSIVPFVTSVDVEKRDAQHATITVGVDGSILAHNVSNSVSTQKPKKRPVKSRKGGGSETKSTDADSTICTVSPTDVQTQTTPGRMDGGATVAFIEKVFKLHQMHSLANMKILGLNKKVRHAKTIRELVLMCSEYKESVLTKFRELELMRYPRLILQVESRLRFLKEVNEGTLEIFNKSEAHLSTQLVDRKFPTDADVDVSNLLNASEEVPPVTFKYLIATKTSDMLKDATHKSTKLHNMLDSLRGEFKTLQENTIYDVWNAELVSLTCAVEDFRKKREEENNEGDDDMDGVVSGGGGGGGGRTGSRKKPRSKRKAPSKLSSTSKHTRK